MIYRSIVEKNIRQTIEDSNNQRWEQVVKPAARSVHHRVSGRHALAGERHTKEGLRLWFERMGRVLPNLKIKLEKVWVTGAPWNTTVFAQWDSSATLLNGEPYTNRGLLVFRLKWGKLHALEEFQDSQEAARGLAVQAAAGLAEAAAEPITS